MTITEKLLVKRRFRHRSNYHVINPIHFVCVSDIKSFRWTDPGSSHFDHHWFVSQLK